MRACEVDDEPAVRLRPRLPVAPFGGVAAIVVLVVVHAWPCHPARHTVVHHPPAAGAYLAGGAPTTDVAIEEILIGDLTQLVVESEVDRGRKGVDWAREKRILDLRAPHEIVRRSDELAAAWRAMIDTLDHWVYMPASGVAARAYGKLLRARVRAVSDQFAALGLGYYLEGDLYGAHAIVQSYRVEDVTFVVADGVPRRVLALRRLDHLNLEHALLGMESAELGDPILLMDQIDEHVATRLLPLLASGAAFPLFDSAWQRSEMGILAIAAGEDARRELIAALGIDADAAAKIGGLLVRRAKLLEGWRRLVEKRGRELPRVEEVFLPDDYFARLAGVAPIAELLEAAAIEESLKRLDAARIAVRCHQLFAATVRRHEAQHGLDEDRDEPLRVPRALSEVIGASRAFGERARNELSAYTSQIANDPRTPQLSLWSLARHAFDRDLWGTPESYVAVVAIEAIAHEIDPRERPPVVHDGEIDRGRLAQLGAALAVVPTGALRVAARRAWEGLFGEPLVPILDR